MKKYITLLLAAASLSPAFAQQDIYHDGWIDFNKNGKMDVYPFLAQPLALVLIPHSQ